MTMRPVDDVRRAGPAHHAVTPLLPRGLPARPVLALDHVRLAGCDRLFVDDPFGNRIELMRPGPWWSDTNG